MGEIKRPSFLHHTIKKLFNLNEEYLNDFVLSDWLPPIDIKEFDTYFQVKLDVPGVDFKDIKIHVELNKLHIAGNKENNQEAFREYLKYERVKGLFNRTILFNKKVSSEYECSLLNGVLEIIIYKI